MQKMTLAIYVRSRRRERALSQAELAKKMGVSRSYISLIESKESTGVALPRLLQISEVLCCNQSTLLILGGYLPLDAYDIFKKHPFEVVDVIRYIGGLSENRRRELLKYIVSNEI